MITEANSRDSESKTEVFEAYHELLGKLKATKKVTRIEEEREEIAQREKKHAVEVMAQQSPQDITKPLVELKEFVNASLVELEGQLVAEQEKLVALRQAIELSNKELADLYDIRTSADTLAVLLLAQREKSRLFEEEMQNKRQALERELREYRLAFDNDMIQKRRSLQQEGQELIFQRDMARERERNEYETRLRHLEEKEAAVEARARQMQEEFRVSMEQERRRVEQEMSLKFDYEAKLLEKEMEGERKVFNQHIAALETKIEHLESLKYSFNKVSFNSAPVDALVDSAE